MDHLDHADHADRADRADNTNLKSQGFSRWLPRVLGTIFALVVIVAMAWVIAETSEESRPEPELTQPSLTPDSADQATPEETTNDNTQTNNPETITQDETCQDTTSCKDLATRFLASYLGVQSQELELSGGAKVWADGSLGCAQQDYFYTTAEVEGYQFAAEHLNKTYYTHLNETGGIIFVVAANSDGQRELLASRLSHENTPLACI